jgi:isochorismate synthase
MDMLNANFFKIFNTFLKQKTPFVIYKRPANNRLEVLISEESQISTYSNISELKAKKGFLFAPFHQKTGKPTFFLPEIRREQFDLQELSKEILLVDEELLQSSEYQYNKNVSKEYISSFTAYQKAFSDNLKKAILSKMITLPAEGLNIPVYFLKIAQKYPNAFVYFVQSEKTSMWLGATPETLISSKNDSYELMSLAGTSKNGEWTNKEKVEQQIVTDYISELIGKFKITNFEKSDTQNLRAGNFFHLMTKFKIPKNELKNKLGDFINDLHPTPAVCGLPKKESLSLILKTEKHNREYYAGYLGTLDDKNNIDLFVNLRCMKIENQKLRIFVGGGITKDSELESEWMETEMKARILLGMI